MANLQKSKYLLQNLVIKQKKNCANCNKLYTSEKPLTQQIQISKKIFKFLKPKCVSRKAENVHIPLECVCGKIFANILCKNCALWLLLF